MAALMHAKCESLREVKTGRTLPISDPPIIPCTGVNKDISSFFSLIIALVVGGVGDSCTAACYYERGKENESYLPAPFG